MSAEALSTSGVNNILVVDDEESVLSALASILSAEGYQTSTATNGVEALEQIKDKAFDLVFTDLKMPEMDGLELIKEVSQLENKPTVVMMSAFANVRSMCHS